MIKKKYPVILIVVVLIVILGKSLISKFSNGAIPVKEVPLQKVIVSKTVSASGKVSSTDEADLSFASSGKINLINVQKGDIVYKGDLIASLDTTTLEANMRSYAEARDIAKRNRDLFLSQYEKNHRLVGTEDQYQIKLKTLEDQLDQATAAYDGAQSSLKNAYIYAPFEATVVDVPLKIGEVSTIGVTVVKLANLDKMTFKISLDEEDIGYVKEGQNVRLDLDAYPNHDFKAKVDDIPLFANSDGSFEVNISIEQEPDYNILMGMNGDAYVDVASTNSEVNALDYDQIYTGNDNKKYVWVLNQNNIVMKKFIETGLEGDLYTEIKNDVPEKIVVPVGLNTKIAEGSKAILMK